jgi:hypothetical protein
MHHEAALTIVVLPSAVPGAPIPAWPVAQNLFPHTALPTFSVNEQF